MNEPAENVTDDLPERAARRRVQSGASRAAPSVPHREPVEIFGVPLTPETLEDAVDRVACCIDAGRPCHIGVVNAAKLVNMRRTPALARAVLASDVIYADGMSIVLASRLLGSPLPERVAGIDLMLGILERGNRAGYRVYCLGATEEVSRRAAKAITDRFPNVHIVGRRNGYFDERDEPAIVEDILRSGAHVLFVAISSPKKELFMARWADRLPLVTHGVGGSFDVLAGLVQRAPRVWQRCGLEWLYRVVQEPRRLWKRYLTTNSAFGWLLLTALLRRAFRLGNRLAR
ncbi:MAG: WecB/TagA/CpsF family glycosyltransferase [Gammaproteobacteria bacterium]|nr:glycosyltransferase [Gammaproteobacteria bacterium]